MKHAYIKGFAQCCSISIANVALVIPRSCTEIDITYHCFGGPKWAAGSPFQHKDHLFRYRNPHFKVRCVIILIGILIFVRWRLSVCYLDGWVVLLWYMHRGIRLGNSFINIQWTAWFLVTLTGILVGLLSAVFIKLKFAQVAIICKYFEMCSFQFNGYNFH